jgi:hypothetical protein
VGWLVRKAAGFVNVSITINEYQDDHGVWHIDVDQPGTSEAKVIDGSIADREDSIFGRVQESSRWLHVSELSETDVEDVFLRQGWLDDELMEARSESAKNDWKQRTIWGFQNVIDGDKERRTHVRKLIIKKGDEVVRATFVYDLQEA